MSYAHGVETTVPLFCSKHGKIFCLSSALQLLTLITFPDLHTFV